MPYLGLIIAVIWILCLIDVIASEEHAVRNLPKMAWLFIVLIIPLAGSFLWLFVGRPIGSGGFRPPPRQQSSAFPEYDRPGRHIAQRTEADEEFLRQCRARAEEQRQIAREQRRRNEGN